MTHLQLLEPHPGSLAEPARPGIGVLLNEEVVEGFVEEFVARQHG